MGHSPKCPWHMGHGTFLQVFMGHGTFPQVMGHGIKDIPQESMGNGTFQKYTQDMGHSPKSSGTGDIPQRIEKS